MALWVDYVKVAKKRNLGLTPGKKLLVFSSPSRAFT
jgi:hypothetical protein